jgi:2-oxoglutarate ferredoxin oxidoreductase subunit alpha
VLAPCDIPEAVELVQLGFHLADRWRNPVLFFGDYYLAHVQEAVDIVPLEFGDLPEKDWAVDGSSSGSGRAKLISSLSVNKSNDPEPIGYGGKLEMIGAHIDAMAAGVEPLVDVGHIDDADLVVVAFGTPGRYIRHVVTELRAEGLPVGYIRPITLWPFPSEVIAAAAERAAKFAVYELNHGQMIDDVRLAVEGRAPVEFIGGASFDYYGFGIAPDLDVEVLTERVRQSFDALTATSTR